MVTIFSYNALSICNTYINLSYYLLGELNLKYISEKPGGNAFPFPFPPDAYMAFM